MAALTRWTNGRFPRAFEFIQGQRRRYILITQMAELLQEIDVYVPAGAGQGQWDIGLHAQTGHPCAVVPYKFDVPPQQGRPGGAANPAPATPAPALNPQPIGAVITGALYNDDKILSVAHQFQVHDETVLKHPAL